MRSTFSGLNTVVRGIFAQQVSLDTVGHNIVNANTDGYSRQSVNLGTTSPQSVYGQNGTYQVGTGVDVESVTRARDTLVDRQMWKESATLGYGKTIQDSLGKIEGVFEEPQDTGIQTVLNKFWKAWQTLSTNGSDNGARTALRETGVELVDAIQHSAQQLRDMVSDVNATLKVKVADINEITSEIASLNRQISNIEAGGKDHANDLRDRRDLLVDKLSSLMKVNVTEDSQGNYSITSSGVTLVNDNLCTELGTATSVDPDYGYEIVNVTVKATGQVVNFTNGEMKGLIDSRDDTDVGAKGYLDKLATVSKFLLQEFNEVHRKGYGTDDSTNNNFFGDGDNNSGTGDPDYQSATVSGSFTKGDWINRLKVNPDLFDPIVGLSKIAAKTTPGTMPVTQSNLSGGALTLGGSYSGAGNTTFDVRIDSVDSTGQITGASYRVNGGSWVTAAIDSTATPPKISLRDGLIAQIATNSNNAANDTYTFVPPQGNASGDNAILLGNRLKTDISANLGNASLDGYYSSVIGALGVQSQNAQRLTENQQTLVDQIKNWRESTAGVNMDEEMSNMIRFQKGYNAAARILTTMDQMLDTLINNTGVVGR